MNDKPLTEADYQALSAKVYKELRVDVDRDIYVERLKESVSNNIFET